MHGYSLSVCYLVTVFFVLGIITPELRLCNSEVCSCCYVIFRKYPMIDVWCVCVCVCVCVVWCNCAVFYRAGNAVCLGFFLTSPLLLFSAITAACSENLTKHTDAHYVENVEFLKVKPLWYIKRTLDFEGCSGRGFRSAESVFLGCMCW
jgi:hypothetical protein